MADDRKLTVLDGAASITQQQFDAEWLAAWERISSVCEESLATVHPLHPRRDLLLAASREARRAARQPMRLEAS